MTEPIRGAEGGVRASKAGAEHLSDARIDVDELLGVLDWNAKLRLDLHQVDGFEAKAAQVIRALRADFERYATHTEDCLAHSRIRARFRGRCTCGLDAARARWASKKESPDAAR